MRPTQLSPDLGLLVVYQRLLRRWPWLFIAGLLGASLGAAIDRVVPPTYRSTALLSIGVDYSRSRWLDEDADRMALSRVQDLLLSDETLAGAVNRFLAAELDPPIAVTGVAELRGRLGLIWVDSHWQLSARSDDPQEAATLANAWAESGLEQLAQAAGHASRVAQLQGQFFRVYCRPDVGMGEAGQPVWVCDEGEPAADAVGLPEALITEIQASRGIIPTLTATLAQAATPPAEPEYGGRALRLLGGTLTGLLVGVLTLIALEWSGLSPWAEAAQDSAL
jgi:uncharacterized protein involved in exopolysaccharide biosynthesis